MMMINLFRSLLFVPAYSEKYLKSAFKSVADAIIVDLEDSVPLDRKEDGRRNICNLYQFKNDFKGQVIVRVNALNELEEVEKDLQIIDPKHINGLMLPKIESSQDIEVFENLEKMELGIGKLYYIPLIENAESLLNLRNILAKEKVLGLAFGGEDYITDINGRHGDNDKVFDYPRSQIIISAKAYNKIAIDTPYLKIDDFEGLRQSGDNARNLGFDGKLIIHPYHSSKVNEIFTPSKEQYEYSEKVVKLIERSNIVGKGVSMINGKMIGPPMEKRARKVIEVYSQIEYKNKGVHYD